MFLKLDINARLLSQVALASFITILAIALTLSEFFQAPKENVYDLSKYRILIPEEALSQVVKIDFKNRLGTFKFELQNNNGRNEWHIVSPRSFPANHESLQLIFEALKKISIRKIFERDKININNFSLDYPLMSIQFYEKNGETISLDLGLINPVDSSTYVSISNQPSIIYHINALENALEKLDLTSFVESRIFHLEKSQINSIKVLSGNNSTIFQVHKKDDNWFGRNDTPLENEKVEIMIDEMLMMKSLIIIDRMPEGAKDLLTKSMGSDQYIIQMGGREGETFTYHFSNLLPAISDLKLEKFQNIIVSSPERRFPYILSKDVLSFFTRNNEGKLKKIPFKKLFY